MKKGLKVTNKDSIKKDNKNEFGAMNDLEIKSANKADKEVVDLATVDRLQLLRVLVSKKLNLNDEFSVCKFDDKGKVMDISLENEDFIISVRVKDSERHSLVVNE